MQPADAAKAPEAPRSVSPATAAHLAGLSALTDKNKPNVPPKVEGERGAALPERSPDSATTAFTGAEVPPRYKAGVEEPPKAAGRRLGMGGAGVTDSSSDPSRVSRPPQPWETEPIMPPSIPPPRTAESHDADVAPEADRREEPMASEAGAAGAGSLSHGGGRFRSGAWLVQGVIHPAEAAPTRGSSQREPSPGLPSPARSSSPAPPFSEPERLGRGRAGRDSVSPGARAAEAPLFELLQEMRQTMWGQHAHPLQQQVQLPGIAMQTPPQHMLHQNLQHQQQLQLQQLQQQQEQWHQHQQNLQHFQQAQALNNPWPGQPSGSFQPMPPVQSPSPPAQEVPNPQPPKLETPPTSSKEVQVEPESRSRDSFMFQEFRAKQQQARQAHPELRSAREDLARQIQAVEARSSELRQRCAEAEREGLEDFERLRCYLNSVEALKQGTLSRERDIRMQLIDGIDSFCRRLQQAEAPSGKSEAVTSFLAEYPDVQSAADALCSRACSLPQVDVRIDDVPFEARSKNDKLRRYVVADRLLKAKDLCLWRLEQQRRRLAAEAQEGADWVHHLGGLLDRYAEELGQVCYFCSERFCAAAANTCCPYNLRNPSLPDQRVPHQLWGAGVHFWVPLPATCSAAAAVAQQSLASAASEGPRPFAPLVESPRNAPVDYGLTPMFPSSRHAQAFSRREEPAPCGAMPGAHGSRFGNGWESGGAVAQRVDPILSSLAGREACVAPPAGSSTGAWPSRPGGGGGGPLPPVPPPPSSSSQQALLPQHVLSMPTPHQPAQPAHGSLPSQPPLLPQHMPQHIPSMPMSHHPAHLAQAPAAEISTPTCILGDPAAQELWQRLGRVFRERGVLARQAFALFDADGNGAVSRHEIFEGFRLMKLGLSDSELERLMGDIDTNRDGLVNIHEFGDRLQLLDLQASH